LISGVLYPYPPEEIHEGKQPDYKSNAPKSELIPCCQVKPGRISTPTPFESRYQKIGLLRRGVKKGLEGNGKGS